MIFIEQDAKRLLMERLDKCLKIHADMLDAQNIGSIYELQGFSELHYYLKAEHEFTPGRGGGASFLSGSVRCGPVVLGRKYPCS